MSAKELLKVGLGVSLLVVLVLAAGCASGDADADRSGEATGIPSTVELDAEADGSQVELSPGQVLAVTLESNPSTGYGWEVSEVDAAVLAQMGEAEFREAAQEGEQLVGAPGAQILRFVAGAGETTLTLVYRRSWEKDVEPLETFTVEVVVK